MITKEDIQKIYNISDYKVDVFTPILNEYMGKYGINNRLRIAAFLAQVGHESGRLRYTEELASGAAYEGRTDLGNYIMGYGVKYKGRGLIQITGYYNYKEVSDALGIDFVGNPKMLATPLWAVASACWWWKARGLNELADLKDFKKITKIINGGYNGLEDREQLYQRALKELEPSI